MKPSILGKRALSGLLHAAGLPSMKFKNAAESGLLILMYHRVVDGKSARSLGQEGMYVEVATFENHLRLLKRRFLVVSLVEAIDILERRRGGITTGSKPLCAITFDDGWRDVYENAYPLLLSFRLPATIFLPTWFIGTTKRFWTDRLASFLSSTNPEQMGQAIKELKKHSVSYSMSFEGRKEISVDGIIEDMKHLPEEKIERILEAFSEGLGMDAVWEQRAFLSWEEASEMFRSGFVRFGSHTERHRILTTLSEEEVAAELRGSRNSLIDKGVVDPGFIPFAYPNGNYTDRIASMVSAAGYRLAVTTKKGWNHATPVLDTYRLNRIGIHQDVTSTDSLFSCRLAEIL